MKTGIIYDRIYLNHDTGTHPENSGRLVAIMKLLQETGLLEDLVALSPRMATDRELLSVHSRELVQTVESSAASGGAWLDGDTFASRGSYKAALYAVGGLLRGVDSVLEKEVDSAFALVRPPGHHATPTHAMGFCLFNNVAIAAKYALQQHGLSRVLIVDTDVHHGNGTQDAFYNDPQVLYFSTHQSPHYPGSGDIDETGRGEGRGTTVNVPLPSGCTDAEYLRVYNEILVPIARRYEPELILVSAGFDTHWTDRLAMMQLTLKGIAGITTVIKGLADELCRGRLLCALEGGYDLGVLSAGVRATFQVLQGETSIDDPMGEPKFLRAVPSIDGRLSDVKRIHQLD